MAQASSAGSNANTLEQLAGDPEGQVAGDPAAESSDGGGDANEQVQSSSTDDATESTLAAVIAKAAGEKAEPEPESSTGSEQESETEGEAPEEEAGKTADSKDDKHEEDADVPFHKHPRWKELKRERDSYREGHHQFQQIESYMQANGLSAEEVATGYEIMALIRRDPKAALEKLQPYVQSLELATGQRLPDDLAARVEDGVVDQDTAQETARLRFEAQRRQALEESSARGAQQAALQSIQSTVANVEQEIRSADPDFARKQPFVMDRVRALIAETRPQTPEAAAAIVRQAHSEVSERLKPMIQRKPVRTMTSGDSSTSGRAAPTTLYEAIAQAAKGN